MPDLFARLARLNRSAVFLVTLAVVLVALFAPDPIGGLLLLLLAAGLAAVALHTWPVQPPATRALRLLVLGLLVVIALTKLF
ncbi:MAG: DUF6703 family protein [Micromonosporaceae bacterium]